MKKSDEATHVLISKSEFPSSTIFFSTGLVTRGIITEGMRLKVGPFEDGSFRVVTVTSIKRNRAPCRLVRATQSAALALDISYHILRKGMVLVDARSGK